MENAKPDVPRSPHWPVVRRAHLQREPACAVCGTKEHLEVHHIQPFHLAPALELVDSNLITLCETPSHNDHLLFGHLLFWPAFNPVVREDTAAWHEKIAHRPLALTQERKAA